MSGFVPGRNSQPLIFREIPRYTSEALPCDPVYVVIIIIRIEVSIFLAVK